MKKIVFLFIFSMYFNSIFATSSVLTGKITDKKGIPISNVDIKAKNGLNYFEVKTDKKGRFSLNCNNGIISILAEKNGFYNKGATFFIDKKIGKKNINISLERKFFYVSGMVTDGKNYLKNRKVELYDSESKKLVASTFSNTDGIFDFVDIPFIEKAFFKVENSNTNTFILNKDFQNFNIFID